MTTSKPISVLNRLLKVLCHSLPAYLGDADPWAQSGDQQLRAALAQFVADLQRYARRLAEAIVEQGGQPDPGGFPMAFTAKNDLALEFLVREVIDRQQEALSAIKDCAAEFEDIAPLHALAEEILGNVRGHLDILKETMNVE